MLAADDLLAAMDMAVARAKRCKRWCSHGAELTESGYRIWHNGAGSFETVDQAVYAEGALAWDQPVLTTRLAEWIWRLHEHEPVDFNMLAPLPPASGQE